MAITVENNAQFVESVQKDLAEGAEEAPAEAANTEMGAAKENGAAKESIPAAQSEATDENGLTAEERKGLTEKMQRTVGKRHRQMREAEEFAADQYNQRRLAEDRAARLEAELTQLKGKSAPPADQAPAADAGKPKRERFQTDEAYQDALTEWRVDQRLKERDAQAAKERQAAEAERIQQAASQRIARALELVPDFQEVTETVDMTVPAHIAGAMAESELFAELGYHFAKNPQVLEELSKMPAHRALLALGKIEATLQPFAPASGGGKNAKEPTQPSPSDGAKPSTETGSTPQAGASPSRPRAAAPITPLSSGGASVEKDPADMNIRETITDWQKARRVDLGRRRRH